MEVSDFIQAMVQILTELFPGQMVYVEQIPAGAENCLLVRCIKQSHQKRLDRRRVRAYQFEILSYPRSGGSMDFYEWTTKLYTRLERLTVCGQVFHMGNLRAESGDDGVLHFLLDTEFTFLLEAEPGDPMERLDQQLYVE